MVKPIQIGKGESKSIIFNVIDKDDILIGSDKLLFAIKNDATSKEFLFTAESLVGDITPTENSEGHKVYSFLVQITTAFSRSLSIRDYYYDLTLIDEHGEEKPLMSPSLFTITKTIGASLPKDGA